MWKELLEQKQEEERKFILINLYVQNWIEEGVHHVFVSAGRGSSLGANLDE